MSGRRSQVKGANWEREVAHMLEDVWPEARRSGHLQRARGSDDPDVLGVPFHVECKVGKRPLLRAALAQAATGAEVTGKAPVAVVKDNGAGQRPAQTYALMKLDDWLLLVKEARRHKG